MQLDNISPVPPFSLNQIMFLKEAESLQQRALVKGSSWLLLNDLGL